MRIFLIAAVTAASIASAAAQTAKPAPVNIVGKWTMTLELEAFTATPTLEFKTQTEEKITGTYTGRYGTFPFEGKLKERAIEFSFKMSAEGNDVEVWFSGEVTADGQTMKGKGSLTGLGDATWTAKKEKS
jgi:hypothetical protein